MNGARALIQTLVDSGVDVCFTNPGTSEMHFVAALDEVEPMRGILCLFEGGATGAADGYARMADKPAGTLLHLGPGLGNGFANLHNARRARTPVVNIVGDHATYHKQYDAPLESDIDDAALLGEQPTHGAEHQRRRHAQRGRERQGDEGERLLHGSAPAPEQRLQPGPRQMGQGAAEQDDQRLDYDDHLAGHGGDFEGQFRAALPAT